MGNKPGQWTPTATALRSVVEGPYERLITFSQSVDIVAGTELEGANLPSRIAADVKNEVFSWVRLQFSMSHATNPVWYEWMLIRCDGSESMQDLSDPTVVEFLQMQKRILQRGLVLQYGGNVKLVKCELYNLEIPVNEELRFVIRPFLTCQDVDLLSLLEYRQVGGVPIT